MTDVHVYANNLGVGSTSQEVSAQQRYGSEEIHGENFPL